MASEVQIPSLFEAPPSPTRSAIMARVRSKNTAPELAVRKTAFSLGYRFRLHRRDLSGSPDLVFPAKNKVIFVHGCFWHRHQGCPRASSPVTRQAYWQKKFDATVARDIRNIKELELSGWQVLVLWECAIRDKIHLIQQLQSFLGPNQVKRTHLSMPPSFSCL
jgi:DNA mismatch endonuclease, patch repair protein